MGRGVLPPDTAPEKPPVTVPMFTTLPRETAEYVMDFTDMALLFVGQTENWDQVCDVLPAGITLVTLPGAEIEQAVIAGLYEAFDQNRPQILPGY